MYSYSFRIGKILSNLGINSSELIVLLNFNEQIVYYKILNIAILGRK